MTASRRALIIAHASVVDRLEETLAGMGGEADVLLLGSGGDDARLAPGLRRIGRPAPRGWGYREVLIAWPNLQRSAVRGALRGLALSTRARRLAELDVVPGSELSAPRATGRAAALVDAAAWSALTVGSLAAAGAAALALRLVPGSDLAVDLPDAGAVLYLRTDLDLATATGAAAGGAAAHTAGVVGALRRRQPVRVAVTGRVGVDDESALRLPVVAPANVAGEVAELLSGLLQAAFLLRRCERPALVYQRYSLNNLAGAIAAARWRVPFVLEANASEAGWRRHWGTLRIGPLADAAERVLLRRADRIAAVSTVVARDLIAAGAAPERVVVVPNAADWETFARAEPAPLPFDPDAFVIAFAGSFYPWHGVPFLAEAFAALVRRRPDSRLLLVGDGTARGATAAILEREGVADRVHWTGLVPRGDVPGLLAAADVLVSPHAEWADFIGSPVKVFEYMASGRAIVATRVGQIGDVLRDRETALLVAPSDAAALEAALVDLHDDPARRTALGRAAGEEARERHSWDARVAALLAPRR